MMRSVKILAILTLIWLLVADMLKLQSLDTSTIVVLVASITSLDANLKTRKKKK